MRASKNILSILCLLALLTSLAVFGVDHIYRASQATPDKSCTVCIDCDEDEYEYAMACCMGTVECGASGPIYGCDGDFFDCDGWLYYDDPDE